MRPFAGHPPSRVRGPAAPLTMKLRTSVEFVGLPPLWGVGLSPASIEEAGPGPMGFPAADRRDGSPPTGAGQRGEYIALGNTACGASVMIR